MMPVVKKEHRIIVAVYAVSIVYVFSSIFLMSPLFVQKKSYQIYKEQKEQKSTKTAVFNKNAFSRVRIEGKAYVVYDLVSQEVIASYNENQPLPLASVTKVMTAVSAMLHKPKDEKITVTKKSIEDGYDLGLKNNQVWSLGELLKYTLVFSSNDGAEVVADSFGGRDIFIAQMNADAKKLGLNLLFTDPAGRDMSGNIGGTGTALDVAKLFGIARKTIPDLLDATTKKRQTVRANSGRISGVPNTNQQIEDLSGAEASKTGYTDLAGGNLGVVVDITVGRPVVIVVLGSSREGRFRDMSLLYKALRESASL
jgi:D-alanyl-D-alanine carboxypeptidase